ncbi:MAG: hypothetical protein Q7T63_13255 [Burkholderiaceae bacterium]|nr:hypothetical protein [Burkholderiaceae bacterium]
MTLILLEALGALVALLLIVWWTMFSGRKNGEPPGAQQDPGAQGDKVDPLARD